MMVVVVVVVVAAALCTTRSVRGVRNPDRRPCRCHRRQDVKEVVEEEHVVVEPPPTLPTRQRDDVS